MPASETSMAYSAKQRVWEEAQYFGGYTYGPANAKLGHVSGTDYATALAHSKGQRLDGKECLRRTSTTRDVCTGMIKTFDSSVNEMFGRMSIKDERHMGAELRKAAILAMNSFNAHAGKIRSGAGGKVVERADVSYVMFVHGWAADGAPNLHAHIHVDRYAIRADGTTGSRDQRNKDFDRAKDVFTIIDLHMASVIERDFGHKVNYANGKLTVPAFSNLPKDQRLTGHRRQEALNWMAQNGWNHDPALVAKAIRYTKRNEKRPTFTHEERVATWHKQLGLDVRRDGGTAGRKKESARGVELVRQVPTAVKVESAWAKVLNNFVKRQVVPANRVAALALMRAVGINARDKYKVNNLGEFLSKVKRRSIASGHRAAYKALLKAQVGGIREALDVAEAAFKEGRKPLMKVKEGSRVHLTKAAMDAATDKQINQLHVLAKKNNWKVTGYNLRERIQQSQDQENGVKRGV